MIDGVTANGGPHPGGGAAVLLLHSVAARLLGVGANSVIMASSAPAVELAQRRRIGRMSWTCRPHALVAGTECRPMSWDLQVVTHRRPDTDLVRAGLPDGLLVEGVLDPGLGNLLVSRTVRGGQVPAFTVDGPFGVEPDDVERIGPALVSPCWMVTVAVPVGEPESVRAAGPGDLAQERREA
jgi:hypothetical protein